MVKVYDNMSISRDADQVPSLFRKYRFAIDIDGIDSMAFDLRVSGAALYVSYYLTAERPIAWYSGLDADVVRPAVAVFYDGRGEELERIERMVRLDGWEADFSYASSDVATVQLRLACV